MEANCIGNVTKVAVEIEKILEENEGKTEVTISIELLNKVYDYITEYDDMCPRDAREFLNCGYDCQQCNKGCMQNDEDYEEETCLTCHNSFSDENDRLHCMAEGHDSEKIVEDDDSCDDWE